MSKWIDKFIFAVLVFASIVSAASGEIVAALLCFVIIEVREVNYRLAHRRGSR